ncbi:MAG TPA: HDIG domain-containing protein [Acidimicrobiia bacterium]
MPGSLRHLAGRFFDVLSSKPLSAAETAAVRGWLTPAEAGVFFSQPTADQRHGYHAATIVDDAGERDLAVLRAALLHDIGKRHARLGVIGRTFASLLIRFRLPLTAKARLYRGHGELAAEELEQMGCETLVIEFARHHHGARPDVVPPATWDLLQLADEPPKTRTSARARIT